MNTSSAVRQELIKALERYRVFSSQHGPSLTERQDCLEEMLFAIGCAMLSLLDQEQPK